MVTLTWEHTFSSFNDRLSFPIGTFTGPFLPEADPFGYSSLFPVQPGKGPTPIDVGIGNYFIDPSSPSQANTDRVALNWTASPSLNFKGNASYTRLRDTYTNYPQNSFDTDNTVNWRPINRLQLTPVADWNLGLGYSYQQYSFTSYMAFQNDSGAGYILDEPLVPYKQITQAYWAESSYLAKNRMGLNLRITYNSSRSGFRPDVNPNDAAKLGNACLIGGTCDSGTFDPSGLFPSALNNLQFSATQISEVIVPQWIGQGKSYYLLPHKFEGGFVFYYGSYRDYWNPNLNGVLRTFNIYVGKSW